MKLKVALKSCKGNIRGRHKPKGEKSIVKTGRYQLTKKQIAHQASELRTHNGSLPVDAISSPEPQLLSCCHIWSGKYPGTFESTHHHNSPTKNRIPGYTFNYNEMPYYATSWYSPPNRTSTTSRRQSATYSPTKTKTD